MDFLISTKSSSKMMNNFSIFIISEYRTVLQLMEEKAKWKIEFDPFGSNDCFEIINLNFTTCLIHSSFLGIRNKKV